MSGQLVVHQWRVRVPVRNGHCRHRMPSTEKCTGRIAVLLCESMYGIGRLRGWNVPMPGGHVSSTRRVPLGDWCLTRIKLRQSRDLCWWLLLCVASLRLSTGNTSRSRRLHHPGFRSVFALKRNLKALAAPGTACTGGEVCSGGSNCMNGVCICPQGTINFRGTCQGSTSE